MDEQRTRQTLLLKIRDLANAEAWGQFVEIYEPVVMRFALWRGLDRSDAADITQEVMAKVARSIRDFEYDPTKGTFRGWLLTVTRRQISGMVRKSKRRPQLVSSDHLEDVPETPEETDIWETQYRRRMFDWACGMIRASFEEATWQAFWMTTVEGKSGAEASSALGLTPGAVYVAKSRVLQRVRERIASVADEWDVAIDPGGAA